MLKMRDDKRLALLVTLAAQAAERECTSAEWQLLTAGDVKLSLNFDVMALTDAQRAVLGKLTDVAASTLGTPDTLGAAVQTVLDYMRGDFARSLPFFDRQALKALIQPLVKSLEVRRKQLHGNEAAGT